MPIGRCPILVLPSSVTRLGVPLIHRRPSISHKVCSGFHNCFQYLTVAINIPSVDLIERRGVVWRIFYCSLFNARKRMRELIILVRITRTSFSKGSAYKHRIFFRLIFWSWLNVCRLLLSGFSGGFTLFSYNFAWGNSCSCVWPGMNWSFLISEDL